MSHAALQASAFYKEVASSGRVFTVIEDGSFLVFPHKDGEVVPFWSSRARVERVQKLHPKYRAHDCDEIPLEVFLDRTLEQLQHDGIRVGVNWSGKRLTGYDLAVPDLLKNLEYWMTKSVAARE